MPDEVAFLECVNRLAEIAPSLLKQMLHRGAGYADLFYERTAHHQVTVRQRRLRGGLHQPAPRHQRTHLDGVGLHVLDREHSAFVATDDLSQASLKRGADQVAIPTDDGAGAAPRTVLSALESYLDLPGDAPEAIADAEKEVLVREAVDTAFALDERVREVKASYQDRTRRTLIATSDGLLRAQANMLMGLRVAVTMKGEARPVTTQAITGGAVGFGHFFEHRPQNIARQAVEQAQRLVTVQPLRASSMPVVLAGGWGGVWLHEAVGHWLEADTIANGTSPFAGKVGATIASPGVHLVDDATIPGGRGTYAFDDEGTPAQRTSLIEAGVLRGILTDRRNAHQMNRPPTGNGRRQDYRYPPLPRMTNLLLLGGEADLEDLFAEVKDGLYVTAIGHGRVQPGAGLAFYVLEGYRIERGQLTTPVTDVRILGQESDVLKGIVGIGRSMQIDHARGICQKAGQVVPVSVGMPPVLIRAMQVAPL
ncbi:MAG TPA: TldD/PmbA family protein [Rhodothermales bacterium]|nr:TldD/PmbA family protein [Rhodothermales bacterium]